MGKEEARLVKEEYGNLFSSDICDRSFSEIRKTLDYIENQAMTDYPTFVEIKTTERSSFDGDDISLVVIRRETEKEIQKRLKDSTKRAESRKISAAEKKARIELKERELLQKLKNKYEVGV